MASIDSYAEALIRVCATSRIGAAHRYHSKEISAWCVQGTEPEPLVIDGHDPTTYRLKAA